MLAQPLPDLAAWSQYLTGQPIPVLLDTAEELSLLAEVEARHGTVDAHLIDDAVGDDPLMTLQVLTHVSRHRTDRQITDVDTVTAAVVLMGIGPFFQTFSPPLVLDDHLEAHPRAVAEIRRLIRRAWCAARLVTEFALLHTDGHASALQKAALLHGHANILLWCHAPVLAQAVRDRCEQDPAQDSAHHERAVLNIELRALEHQLARDWGLPATLRRLTDPDDARSQILLQPQRRLLELALMLADRLDREGTQATPTLDELDELSTLLTLSTPSVQRLIDNTLA
ncbi:HDOD domain-containing protein [Sphaerotilus sp.]|uniref:HDOD domain-containing protein n=1 Tax=Sphaerotilus sp. TaxID=2093942 RepID=UPI00286EAFCB|nr:HDOD domain-containing protein [Sphaerotilus sp.]